MSKEEGKETKPISFKAAKRWAALAVIAVIVTDLAKARQFATFGIAHIEWFYTLSWLLDGLVAGIVTFALAFVALSLRRMEIILEGYEKNSEETLVTLDGLKRDIHNVSRGLAAKGGILEKLDSPTFRKALEFDSALNSSFIEGLNQLTGAWVTLIENEFNRSGSGATNYGLICWRATIATYLAEEASDIKKSTIATNIGVYLKLIETLVEEVRAKTKGTNITIELFAATALLPSEYFNWKEYGTRTKDQEVLSTSPPFMDDYRNKIKSWLKQESLTLTRVILVDDLKETGENLARIANLSLQKKSDLKKQAHYGILCNLGSKQPEKLVLNQIPQYIEQVAVPGWLKNKDNATAYAITRDFQKSAEELLTENLTKRDLFQVFEEEFHSQSKDKAESHARYLAIHSEQDLEILDWLPKIPNSTERAAKVEPETKKELETESPTPDFLVIQLKQGVTKPKAIACIAALMKPNFETMALRLITDPRDLDHLERFIDYCSPTNGNAQAIGILSNT